MSSNKKMKMVSEDKWTRNNKSAKKIKRNANRKNRHQVKLELISWKQ